MPAITKWSDALIVLWCARVAWAVLPLTAGAALADALDEWSSGTATVAGVMLWAAWAAGLVALLAPRPWGLTTVRVVAPAGLLVTITAAPETGTGIAVAAIASAAVAAALALSGPFARAAGDALAYGDEQRFPLHIPTPLLLTGVPVAIVVLVIGVTSGPLLLAAGEPVLGALAVVVGVPAAAVAARSLHALSRRWLVLVPAGVVVVDPLTLMDPVLIRREQIARLEPLRVAGAPADAVDVRVGTVIGSLALRTRAPVAFGRRRGRRGADVVETTLALVAPIRTRAVLGAAAANRIPVAGQTATTPPPSTTSPA